MKPEELRLGNYVGYFGELAKIEGLDTENIYLDVVTADYVLIEDLSPILITEEWLLKFGFERQPYGFIKGEILFKNDLKCTQITLLSDNGYRTTVKYVHQLQNLYFALTGKELKLKKNELPRVD